jgi:hypothetical protein
MNSVIGRNVSKLSASSFENQARFYFAGRYFYAYFYFYFFYFGRGNTKNLVRPAVC